MATSTPTNNPADDNWLGEPGAKLPTTLNVLTWLTFIANGIGCVFAFLGFFGAQANYERTLKAQETLDTAPDWAKKMAGPHPVETARAMLDNRLPIFIITLLACFLCFFGALQMRKLKKAGFSIYILGDVVGYVTGIFIGFDTFASFGYIFAIIITLVFAILYATQLKYMK
ncbi:MAG TPA: hypothetical protein VMH27_12485 [Puia sp.]|nr:hypothetical protein [Puia sp.]